MGVLVGVNDGMVAIELVVAEDGEPIEFFQTKYPIIPTTKTTAIMPITIRDEKPFRPMELLYHDFLWNLSFNNKIMQDLQYKPVYALIAKEPKPTDFEPMLRGQDSDLLRKLMGLPGKPFPTLPRFAL